MSICRAPQIRIVKCSVQNKPARKGEYLQESSVWVVFKSLAINGTFLKPSIFLYSHLICCVSRCAVFTAPNGNPRTLKY